MKQIEIAVAVLRVTDKAIQVDHGSNSNPWIPKSQISDYSGPSLEEAESIFIPEWLAQEKGMI